jgi:hypothetical protein
MKAVDDAMEDGVVVVAFIGQEDEAVDGLRRAVGEELHADVAAVGLDRGVVVFAGVDGHRRHFSVHADALHRRQRAGGAFGHLSRRWNLVGSGRAGIGGRRLLRTRRGDRFCFGCGRGGRRPAATGGQHQSQHDGEGADDHPTACFVTLHGTCSPES